MKGVSPYPPSVLPVKELVKGTAFFPGGFGLWSENNDGSFDDFPFGGVMILGHDYGSKESHDLARKRGDELDCATWRNLMSLLNEAKIPLSQCFFTNVYMGLRKGCRNTGKFPGSSDQAFVDRCQSLLSNQIRLQHPRIILTLGIWVPRLLAPLSKELECWRSVRNFQDLDTVGALIRNCRFEGVAKPVQVVALTHPCMRGSNVKTRRFSSHRGHAAELAMIKKVVLPKN